MSRADGLYRYIQSKIPAKFQAVIAAEDVLQDVWIGAYRGLSSFNPSRPDALDRWLTGITNHKLIDAIKTAGRLKRGGGAKVVRAAHSRRMSFCDLFARVASPHRSPSRDAAASEVAHAVQIALSRLPADWRRAIRMRFIEGQSQQEIARHMGRTEAAVNGLLFRGLQGLRDRLGDATRFFSDA